LRKKRICTTTSERGVAKEEGDFGNGTDPNFKTRGCFEGKKQKRQEERKNPKPSHESGPTFTFLRGVSMPTGEGGGGQVL